MIKPIAQHQNYYFTPAQKKIYGLTAEGVTDEIEIIDQDGEPVKLIDFWTKNGELYFSVEEIDDSNQEDMQTKICYYKQDKSGKVSQLATEPTRPELHRVILENGEFSIKNFDYHGTICSDVKNETQKDSGIERFLLVNGFSHFPGVGLFFNIAEGRPKVRKTGLAFWPLKSQSYQYVKLPNGEIW